jgi:hypothetical protein
MHFTVFAYTKRAATILAAITEKTATLEPAEVGVWPPPPPPPAGGGDGPGGLPLGPGTVGIKVPSDDGAKLSMEGAGAGAPGPGTGGAGTGSVVSATSQQAIFPVTSPKKRRPPSELNTGLASKVTPLEAVQPSIPVLGSAELTSPALSVQ